MPRSGSGVYSLPAGYLAVTGQTIQAVQHNTPLEDLRDDANAVRPQSAGGTGASSLGDATVTPTGGAADSLADHLAGIPIAATSYATGDGSTDDTTAFGTLEAAHPGMLVDLRGKSYVVTTEPRGAEYFNGSFIIGGLPQILPRWPQENIFGRCGIKPVAADRARHLGFNSYIFAVNVGNVAKWVVVYRKGISHGLDNGAEVWAETSYDMGQTWQSRRLVFKDDNYDTRNFTAAVMGSNRFGILCSRRNEALEYTAPIFIYSDDLGETWSSASITVPSSGQAVNFHAALLPYPASVGGHDTSGWISYSYANDRGIDAFYTVDNGATWTVENGVAVPDVNTLGGAGVTYSLSEMSVARCGTQNKWVMVARNARPDGGSTSNAVAYTSVDMLNWSGPINTGLRLFNNPPAMVYDGGKLHVFAFSRRNRDIIPGETNVLLTASIEANAAFSATSTWPTYWRSVTTLPDWASGYMLPMRWRGRWFATMSVNEQLHGGSAGEKTNVLALIGDFVPVTITAAEVAQATPRRNYIANGEPILWTLGTSFSIPNATPVETANGWFGAGRTDVLESVTVERGNFPLGQTDVDGSPTYYIRITSNASEAGWHYLRVNVPNVRLFSGKRVTISFWARSSSVNEISSVRWHQNFGTGGTPTTTETGTFVTNMPISAVWRYRSVTVLFPSIAGKTLGTNNDNYTGLLFYKGAGNGEIDICNVKMEIAPEPSPFESISSSEVAARMGL